MNYKPPSVVPKDLPTPAVLGTPLDGAAVFSLSAKDSASLVLPPWDFLMLSWMFALASCQHCQTVSLLRTQKKTSGNDGAMECTRLHLRAGCNDEATDALFALYLGHCTLPSRDVAAPYLGRKHGLC